MIHKDIVSSEEEEAYDVKDVHRLIDMLEKRQNLQDIVNANMYYSIGKYTYNYYFDNFMLIDKNSSILDQDEESIEGFFEKFLFFKFNPANFSQDKYLFIDSRYILFDFQSIEQTDDDKLLVHMLVSKSFNVDQKEGIIVPITFIYDKEYVEIKRP